MVGYKRLKSGPIFKAVINVLVGYNRLKSGSIFKEVINMYYHSC